jgi:phosphonate transport system substrate-binding protein
MKKFFILLAVLFLASGLVFGAGESEKGEMTEPAVESNLGTEKNPIVWGFVPSGDTQEIVAGGRDVADMIYDKTGLVVEVNVATEYAGVVEAMSADPPSVHMASLNTFSYILASELGFAEVALVAVRYGSPSYRGQIIAHVDSGIQSLEDLEGKTFARPDPLSTSGWVLPMLMMRANGINPETDLEQIVDAGGHNSVMAAVYNKDVDAGSTYEGAQSTIKDQNPDVNEKIKVVSYTAQIPNDGVQFHTALPEDMREQLITALLEIAEDEEGREALEKAYNWTELVRRDDSFYDPFRQMLQASGMSAEELAGKYQ